MIGTVRSLTTGYSISLPFVEGVDLSNPDIQVPVGMYTYPFISKIKAFLHIKYNLDVDMPFVCSNTVVLLSKIWKSDDILRKYVFVLMT